MKTQVERVKNLLRRASVALMVCSAESVLACPSCFGDQNSAEVQGMKWAILSLLGVTSGVLAALTAFIFFLRRQATRFDNRFSDRLN